MVSFILGKGDLDVSDKVREKISELAQINDPNDKIIYIVPEQFESETEYAVYENFKRRGIRGKTDLVNITTFSSLAEGLLSDNGDNRPRADDILKSVVMHKAVSELEGSLSTLECISGKQGFCEKIAETISVFKSAGLGTAELEDKLAFLEESENDIKNTSVFKKLRDVSKIYSHYDQILKAKNYIDSLDMIGLSADLINSSDLFDGAEVFVDCFNDFTNDQLRFLCEVIPKARNMTFGFVTDFNSDSEVFKTANSHIMRLKDCAEETETEFITTGIPSRYDNSALENIPKKLYQDTANVPKKTDSCELISAADIFDELDFVCAKIKELVETRDIRYNNIAVLCTDLSGSGRYLESAFKKYDIPFFLDMRESILRQPLINAVLTLINTLRSFSSESVLSCIKTGFFTKLNDKNERVGLTEHDIGVFEDYLFEWALTTKHLQEPFTFTSSPNGDDKRMETAENIRSSVAEPLYKFHKKLKKEKSLDGAELTRQIYDYLINTVSIECEIQAKCFDPFNGSIDNDTSLMYQRLWDTLIKIFNALYKELEGVRVTVDEYYGIFRDVALSTTLATPPQSVDSVLVGDIDRTRAANIKAAFIIEATFDSFPAPAANIGIFSQYETDLIHDEIFGKNDGEKIPTVFLKSSKEQYRLALYRAYRAVCLPTEYLCVSFAENSPSGELMQITPLADELEKLFKAPDGGGISNKTSDFGDDFFCRSVNAAKLRFARGINSDSKENETLRRALAMQSKDCEIFTARLTELKFERSDDTGESAKHRISPDTARLLFPTQFGATVVEEIAKCKFGYFCQYGLNVRERKQRTFTASRRGDAIHFVLEKVIGLFGGDIQRFCSLKRGELYALSRKYLNEYCAIETNNSPTDDNRTHFLFGNIANAAADTLISMQMEFCSRKYRPKFFELDLRHSSSESVIDNEGTFTAPQLDVKLYENETSVPTDISAAEFLPDLKVNIAPLTLDIDNKLSVKINGRIDRVDMFKENDKIYVRAVDYKTSAHSFNLENAKHGINIQMLMYLSALLDANKGSSLVAGGINYIPTENSGAADAPADPVRLIALNHFSSGLLVVDDVTKADYENYKKYIIDNIPIEDDKRESVINLLECAPADGAGKHPTRIVDHSEFENMRASVFGGVKERFTDIFKGIVDAVPLVYKEYPINDSAKTRDSCKFCRFKSICKNNGKITCGVSGDSSTKENSES